MVVKSQIGGESKHKHEWDNEWEFSLSQTDVMHQSVYELVHTEDQQELRRNLHWALNPPAAASTSSQDSPQGELFSVIRALRPSQKRQSKEIEAALHSRALEPDQEMVC